MVAAAGGVFWRGVDQEAPSGAPAASSTSKKRQERGSMPPFWLLSDPVLQLTIQREIPEYTGGHLGGLRRKAESYFKNQPGEVLDRKSSPGPGRGFGS